MSDDNITLSRRKALAALGATGAAVGLGGLGTYAQFTDTEEQQITFTAGGIDGTLQVSGSYNGEVLSQDSVHVEGVGSDGVGADLHLTDVKPGDFGCLVFDLEVTNNPAWVGSCVGFESTTDGTVYEPEVEDDNDLNEYDAQDTDGSGTPGELQHNILMLPFYDSDLQCGFFDSGGPELPEGGISSFNVPSAFWSNSENSPQDVPVGDGYLAPRTLSDIRNSPGSLNTIQWNTDQITTCEGPGGATVDDGCVFLNGEGSANNQDNTQDAQPLQPGDSGLQFGYDWHIPFDTGNEVQGDEITINLGFTFSQVRHTSEVHLANQYAPGERTPNGGN